LKIRLSAGAGSGPTKLAAFDTALRRAGVANYNLIRLSSIIPPGTCITISDAPWHDNGGEWGDRLYLVYAEMRVDEPGKQAWAGVGWSQDKETGRGLFVEHEGHSEQEVREDIRRSLQAMIRERQGEFGSVHMKVIGIDCKDHPVCALVAAVYRSEPWILHHPLCQIPASE
jgi:arginine decarboxylase